MCKFMNYVMLADLDVKLMSYQNNMNLIPRISCKWDSIHGIGIKISNILLDLLFHDMQYMYKDLDHIVKYIREIFFIHDKYVSNLKY